MKANDTIEQDHASGFHEEPHPDCPICQKERNEAIAKRNAIAARYAGKNR